MGAGDSDTTPALQYLSADGSYTSPALKDHVCVSVAALSDIPEQLPKAAKLFASNAELMHDGYDNHVHNVSVVWYVKG